VVIRLMGGVCCVMVYGWLGGCLVDGDGVCFYRVDRRFVALGLCLEVGGYLHGMCVGCAWDGNGMGMVAMEAAALL